MANSDFLVANNFYTNPFLSGNNFSAPSGNNFAFGQTDFMAQSIFPAGLANTSFSGLPMMGTGLNFPFMMPMFPFGNLGPSQSSNSQISWKNNFSKKTFTQRENKIINEMCQRLNCNPNDLKAIMYSESGCNPQAVNPNGGATGLIQFMPSTAKRLGTTTQQLRNMSFEQQLVYVEKYIKMAKKDAGIPIVKKLDSGTLYSLIFLPAFAGKETLCSAGSSYYNANRGLDKNRDGYITKTDLANRLRSFA